mmetsp:Transcript_90772/g.265705  ORF Transcript_90772/g.265705 Transcript_90772/m.265705 type:complete len:132 (+) Transcript_90772:553-948(+)
MPAKAGASRRAVLRPAPTEPSGSAAAPTASCLEEARRAAAAAPASRPPARAMAGVPPAWDHGLAAGLRRQLGLLLAGSPRQLWSGAGSAKARQLLLLSAAQAKAVATARRANPFGLGNMEHPCQSGRPAKI